MRRHFAETTGLQRLTYSGLAGGAVALIPVPTTVQAHALMAWCVAALVYTGLSWWLAEEFDAHRTRERAQAQDQPKLLLFALMVMVVLVCVSAIANILQGLNDLPVNERSLHIALSIAALALSWMVMHTMFAFRYAHRYYHEEMQGEPDGPGLEFPGKQDPDYFDFLYYSFVVGMTTQVSDVRVTSREMRRLTLGHSILAFGFNMLVLALSINVVAGAVQ